VAPNQQANIHFSRYHKEENSCVTGCYSMFACFHCGLLNDGFSSSDYAAWNGRMVKEVERIWKEAVMAWSRCCTDNFLEDRVSNRAPLEYESQACPIEST
jgi:hypothetical protein